MSQDYKMLQVLTTVPIPDFKIIDRKHPFDSYIEWHRIKYLKEPTDFNRYCYAKALFYDMQLEPAKKILADCSEREFVTHFFRAVPLLLEGNLLAGLPLREYRFESAKYPLHSISPKWDGKPTDKKLIIWQEGGFGDVVQYIRYLPDVLKRVPNASIVIDRRLFELIEWNYPRVMAAFNPQDFQLQCSLMSLPHLLEQYEIDTKPYLKCPPRYIEKWASYEGHIGFVGKGNPEHSSDPLRSLTDEEIGQFTDGRNPGWRSLDPNDTGAKDWTDTAGIIANLDLLITVDTAVAHLAGAMGKPVWVLMNKHHDWRWSHNWYDSMRIFRCVNHSEWQPVFDAINHELQGTVRPWVPGESQRCAIL